MIKVNCYCCNKLIDIKEDLLDANNIENKICSKCKKVVKDIEQNENKTKFQSIKRLKEYYNKEKRKQQKSYKEPTYKEKYLHYINSEKWKQKKEEFYQCKHYHGGCFVCKSTENLEIHHKDYTNLGNEKLTDLVCLCSDCHKRVHMILKTTTDTKITLKNCHVKLRNNKY